MKLLVLLFTLIASTVSAQPLSVFVSILPQQYLLERIGGEQLAIQVLVKPGYSPATYEPLPAQLQALNQSAVYFSVGHLGFEQAWVKKIKALNPDLQVINTDMDISLARMQAQATHHDDHAHLYDPHVWLDPMFAIAMAKQMTTVLSDLDPKNQSLYQQGLAALSKDLQQLHQELKQLFSGLENRRFMVFHPAWGYFAQRYQLEQIALAPIGKTPGPQSLMKVIDIAKQQNIKVIFVQKQFSQHMAKTVAKSIDGTVIAVDPLASSYIDNLKAVAALFVAQ